MSHLNSEMPTLAQANVDVNSRVDLFNAHAVKVASKSRGGRTATAW